MSLNILNNVFKTKDVVVNGYYGLNSNAMYVAQNAFQADFPGIKDHHLFTLHHEVIHAMFNLEYFTPNEIAKLKSVAKKDWIKKYNIEERYASLNLTEEQLLEEAISDAFASYMDGSYQPQGNTLNAFDRIKKLLQSVGKALLDLDFNTPEDIFQATAQGLLAKRKEELDKQTNNRTINLNTKRISKISRDKLNKVKESVTTERTEHFGSEQDLKAFGEYYSDNSSYQLKSILKSPRVPTEIKRHIGSLIEAYELLMLNANGEFGVPEVRNIEKIERSLSPIVKSLQNIPENKDFTLQKDNVVRSINSIKNRSTISNAKDVIRNNKNSI